MTLLFGTIIKENKYYCIKHERERSEAEHRANIYNIDNIWWQRLPNAVRPVSWNVPRRKRASNLIAIPRVAVEADYCIARVAVEDDFPRVAVEADYSPDNV